MKRPQSHRFSANLVAMSLLGLFLDGCGNGTPNASTTVDSAGVRIVTSSDGDLNASVWLMDSLPITVIGTGDDRLGHDLSRLAGAMRLRDGRVVIADGGSLEIRFFDADGAFEYAAGGEGGAPGEFRGLNWIQLQGDTVVGYDPRQQRLSFFDSQGNYLR